MSRFTIALLLLTCPFLFVFSQEIDFLDQTEIAGLDFLHSFEGVSDPMPLRVSGGVATADIDNDGFVDVFVVLGDNQTGVLLHNNQAGSFTNISEESNLFSSPYRASGPLFFNYNQDEYIDLIIGSIDGSAPKLYVNNGDLTFTQVEVPAFDILEGLNTITIVSADYNKDGFDDLFLSHWLEDFQYNHFFENQGDGTFSCTDEKLNFSNVNNTLDFIHTANLCDMNDDSYPDLLLCSDFGTSQIWWNDGGEKFVFDDKNILTDENGMGAAIGDFDNDGDFDWFVSSIYDDDGILEGNWGGSGSKLYVNQGAEIFIEKATEFNIQDTGWGWASSFVDLNNDGYLDLVVVNGWPQGSEQFRKDYLKVFISQEGTDFLELSTDFGLTDTLQGRGLSCFDYDRDGDLDFIVSNYRGGVKLWENNLNNNNNYIDFHLNESAQNPFGIGTIVEVFTADLYQKKIIKAGSNYLSQNPLELHFGLGQAAQIDSIRIIWTDHTEQTLYNVKVNQILKINKLNLEELENANSSCYPNPADNKINFVFERENFESPICLIYNIDGKEIARISSFTKIEKKLFFSFSDLSIYSSGLYLAVLLDENLVVNQTTFFKE